MWVFQGAYTYVSISRKWVIEKIRLMWGFQGDEYLKKCDRCEDFERVSISRSVWAYDFKERTKWCEYFKERTKCEYLKERTESE